MIFCSDRASNEYLKICSTQSFNDSEYYIKTWRTKSNTL